MKLFTISGYSDVSLAYLCLLLADIQQILAVLPTYYMDDRCSITLDMGQAGVSAGRLFLRRPEDGLRFLKCTAYIKAPANKRLSFKFHDFNIQSPQGCNNNNIRLYEDTRLQLPITDRLCNTNKVPNRAYVTSGEDAAIVLDKENFLFDQFDLVFTAFTFSPCRGGEYQCKNDHCIASDLYCNGLDNCGDGSDNCILRPETVIAIIIAAVCIIVVIAIIVAICMYRRQRKIRREREKQFFSDLASMRAYEISNKGFLNDYDWDKRSVSDISSIYSSNIHKNHNILTKRDNQMKMIGYYNKDGSGASTIERHPGFHPYDSEMATKVHYVVHEGGGLSSKPSTLERKLTFMDSPRNSTLEKRSKSLDLRAPFYFDKDGYFSDTDVWQAQEDIYSVPMKKTKKKKGKASISRQPSSVRYAGGQVETPHRHSSKKDKKKGTRKSTRSFVTPPPDYDTPETGVNRRGDAHPKSATALNSSTESQNPLIYVTPPDSVTETLVKQTTPVVETFVLDSHSNAQEPNLPQTSSATQTKIISEAVTQLPEESSITLPTSTTTGYGDAHAASTLPRTWNPELTVGQRRYEDRNGKGDSSTRVSRSSSKRQSRYSVGPSDGSSHALHTAHRAEHHLKEHPHQDSGDIQDQVISFRRYPSPVPKADRQLFRHSSKRSGREN